MVPYFFLLGVPALLAVFVPLQDRERKNRIVIDSFFILFLLLLFLRNESVGIDLEVYKWHFAEYPNYSWKYIFELIFSGENEAGYLLLTKVIGLFTDNFRIVLIICALISVVPIWLMYREEPLNGFLTVLLFINIAAFSMFFSGLRQAMAMGLMYPAYKFTREKKFVPFVISVFVAFLFHKSALIMLLLYPVYHLKLKNKLYLLAILPVIAIVWVFRTPIFLFLLNYLGDDYSDYSIWMGETGAFMVSLLLIIFILYSYILPDESLMDDDTIGLRNILVLSTILQLFSAVNIIAMRINYYFLLLIPLLIPRVMSCSPKENENIAKFSLIVMVLFFTFYYYYKAYTGEDILQIYPYVFMWE